MSRNFSIFIILVISLLVGATAVLARPTAQSGAPALINFQGYATDNNGDPVIDGSYNMRFAVYDSGSGGTKIWEETQNNVPIGGGFFSVQLGSGSCTTGCPLGSTTFNDPTRYLQTSLDTGSGFVDFPRQQLTSVPYALQAAAAPWSGLSGIPAGFADGIDAGSYENVIVVAKSGADYTSVEQALNATSTASASNRYLVWVAPGEYVESGLLQVRNYVHLKGAGQNATVIQSSRSAASPSNAAATVQLDDDGRLSDLTVVNNGTGTISIAVYSATPTSREAVIENVNAYANGSGGTGHYAVYLNDAETTILNSTLKAEGVVGFGTGVNAALGIVNSAGGFPQPLIKNSTLLGGAASNSKTCPDSTGTGFGIQMTNASPEIEDSYICGGHRGLFGGVNGNPEIKDSHIEVSSTGSAFLFEKTGAGAFLVANSGVFYVGNKYTGIAGGLVCVNSYKANYTPASDGTNSATACN